MKLELDQIFTSTPEMIRIIKLIGKLAQEENIQAYAVGGIVRDAILNRENTDIDIMVVGNALTFAEKVAKKLKVSTTVEFEKFGTALIPYSHFDIEIASARKEVYQSDSRKPEVTFTDLKEDLKRRDFTINAMAVDIRPDHWGEFYDQFGGIHDLQIQILKTPLNPEDTFYDDPLRMMRAVRFASQLQYRIHDDTFQAITELASRLEIISFERIRDELIKLLLSPKPSIGLILLYNTGILEIILPEYLQLIGIETKDGYGHKDVFYHSIQVVDNICEYTDDPILRLAAMFHDIAKPGTKRFRKNTGWTFHGHEEIGARIFEKIGRRLKLPVKNIKIIQKLIRLHLRPIAIASEGVTDSAVRRLMVDAGEDIDNLLTLCRADITSRNPEKIERFHNNFTKVEQRIKEVSELDSLRNFHSPVDGLEIMELFSLKPSPSIGIIKEYIEDQILEGTIANDHDEVYLWIKDNFDVLRKLLPKK